MKCGKCSLEITNTKDVIKCVDCSSDLHVTCCRIRTAAKLAQMSTKAVSSWRCDDCKGEVISHTSRSDSEDPSVLDILKNIQHEMAKNNKDNKASFAALNVSLERIGNTLEGVQKRITVIEEENSELKKSCQRLTEENRELKHQVWDMQVEMSELQQYTRNQNLEIKGIPQTKSEDVYAVLESVAKAVGVTFNRGDISIAHRLQARRDRATPAAIVVQFVSRTTRMAWLGAAKRRHISTTDLSASLTPAPVYINEHLTGHSKGLLGLAKSFIRGGHLTHAWTRDGKVFVRKTAGSTAVRVHTRNEVERAAGVSPPLQTEESDKTT